MPKLFASEFEKYGMSTGRSRLSIKSSIFVRFNFWDEALFLFSFIGFVFCKCSAGGFLCCGGILS